ncbi:MAG: insulinase family protein [Acidobacteria bacterium]|nr:insulinase family protein [Acidobacteriota bacterium]
MRCCFFALLIALPLAAQPAAAPLPKGVEKTASVEGITEYRLGNGLRVLLFPEPSKPTVTVNITYLAGSRHESYGETGMAHILEHLVSYGSSRHPDAKAEQAARGAQRNATTYYDRTNYYETFPASVDNLAWAIDLEADRMRTAPMKADILKGRMPVVRNEYEAGENNAIGVLFQRVLSTAFLWHNYGKSTIGARSDIEQVSIEKLQAFYDTFYHPNNAVLTISGKFDEPAALNLIAEKFGPIARSAHPIPRTYTDEPTQDGERMVTLRRTGDLQAVIAGYHVPSSAHPDSGALDLLDEVLTDNPAGRLYKALVETKKAASVGGGSRLFNERGYLTILASVRKDNSLDEVRDILLKTIDGLAATPITAEEVERARSSSLNGFEEALRDPQRAAMTLNETIAAGDWRLLFIQRDRVRAATVADVQRVAAKYLVASNRTLGQFIPEDKSVRAEISKAPDIEALVKDYKGDAGASVGEAFDPSPENIDRRTVRTQLPVGIKLALLSKKTRGATVHGALRLSLGDEKSLQGRRLDATVARDLLLCGTAKHTRQQIQDELNRLRARVNISGSPASVDVTWEATRATLPGVMRLVAEILREPAYPQTEFDTYLQSRLAALEAQRNEPQAVAVNEFGRHLNASYAAADPRAVLSMADSLAETKAATLDGARVFHREFYGASLSELALAGDFDPAEVQSLISTLFGDWKNKRAAAPVRRTFHQPATVNQWFETPDKANAMYVAGLNVNVNDGSPDYPALVLAGYLLGGHAKARFYDRIRGKDGLSYGVFTQFSAGFQEPGGFLMGAITNPANILKVEAAFKEELTRTLEGGFGGEELQSAKNGWLQTQQVRRSQDAALADALRALARQGRTMQYTAGIERSVAALTSAQIVDALKRQVDASRIAIFRAGDFKKAGVSYSK